MNLFSDLYRYREREKKQNLEDWLTECLAAVLRALPKECLATVLAQLTRQNRETIGRALDEISIVTQKRVERGIDCDDWQRPDMLVYLGVEPWLVFENKVSHSVDQSEDGDGLLETQLHRYGAWLKRQTFGVPGLRHALIFVTHQTPVPPDFANSSSQHPAYEGLSRQCSTWGHLARMVDEATSELEESVHARALVQAFRFYLEEQGMASDYPEYKDLAGLSMFIEKGDAFCKLVDGMMERLKALAPFSGNVIWADTARSEGTFGAHRYLKPEKRFDGETFVATGLWFPEIDNDWYLEVIQAETGVQVSPSAKVYLQFANSEDNALTKVLGTPGAGWTRPNSDFFVFRDFASFPTDPTERAIAIFAWVDARSAELKSLLSADVA